MPIGPDACIMTKQLLQKYNLCWLWFNMYSKHCQASLHPIELGTSVTSYIFGSMIA